MVARPPGAPPLTPPAPAAPGMEPLLNESPPRPPTLTCNGRPGTTANVAEPEPPTAPAAEEVGWNTPPPAPIAVAVTQPTPSGTIHSRAPTVVNSAVTAPAPIGVRTTTGTATSAT